jgi:hypothetical protein
MAEDLTELIESNPDSRELKRAVAVQMYLSGLKHREIQGILSVSSGFISKWTQLYDLGGVRPDAPRLSQANWSCCFKMNVICFGGTSAAMSGDPEMNGWKCR